MRARAFLFVALATFGCTPTTVSPADSGTSRADSGTAADSGRTGVVTRTVEIRRTAVTRGSEGTVCVDLPAGITEDALLVGVRTHLSNGSHHLLVSLTDSVTPGSEPFACDPFRHGLASLIFIAQQQEAGFAYPPGAGLIMPAGQAIGLEFHFINYFADEPIDIVGTVELDLIPIPPSFREVHIAFTGELSLLLPAHVETTEQYTCAPGACARLDAGAEILALTSHTHQLGMQSTIDLVTATGTTNVHTSDDWSDPPLDVLSPPIVLGAGDRLELTCRFNNTTDADVEFGEGFGNEMCFLWMYYLDPL